MKRITLELEPRAPKLHPSKLASNKRKEEIIRETASLIAINVQQMAVELNVSVAFVLKVLEGMK